MLEKTYDAKSVEPRIATRWEQADAFRAGANAKPGRESFSIVTPENAQDFYWDAYLKRRGTKGIDE